MIMHAASDEQPRPISVTVLLALVFGPWVSMLYMGRGREAALWLLLEIAAVGLVFLAAVYGVFTPPVLPLGFATIAWTALGLVRMAGLFRVLPVRRFSLERPWFSRWHWLAGMIAVTILLSELPGLAGVRTYSLPSASMAPALVAGDLILTWPVNGRDVVRGDVIVFTPVVSRQVHIKRVAGLPGDKVQMINGVLHINGEAVALKPAGTFIQADDGKAVDRMVELMPGEAAGHYVLDIDPSGLGDNTKEFELAEDELFVLGDNRDNSMDSRFDQLGTVSVEEVQGRLWLLYWNDQGQPLKGRAP